jgi:hypothetical protein
MPRSPGPCSFCSGFIYSIFANRRPVAQQTSSRDACRRHLFTRDEKGHTTLLHWFRGTCGYLGVDGGPGLGDCSETQGTAAVRKPGIVEVIHKPGYRRAEIARALYVGIELTRLDKQGNAGGETATELIVGGGGGGDVRPPPPPPQLETRHTPGRATARIRKTDHPRSGQATSRFMTIHSS